MPKTLSQPISLIYQVLSVPKDRTILALRSKYPWLTLVRRINHNIIMGITTNGHHVWYHRFQQYRHKKLDPFYDYAPFCMLTSKNYVVVNTRYIPTYYSHSLGKVSPFATWKYGRKRRFWQNSVISGIPQSMGNDMTELWRKRGFLLQRTLQGYTPLGHYCMIKNEDIAIWDKFLRPTYGLHTVTAPSSPGPKPKPKPRVVFNHTDFFTKSIPTIHSIAHMMGDNKLHEVCLFLPQYGKVYWRGARYYKYQVLARITPHLYAVTNKHTKRALADLYDFYKNGNSIEDTVVLDYVSKHPELTKAGL